jgi:D-arabinose 5-phosphate isomerase GutQ
VSLLAEAREVIQVESEALQAMMERLDASFDAAVELIYGARVVW